MSKTPILTTRERKTLFIYFLSVVVVALLWVGIGWVKDGLPREADPNLANIAVLAPLSGPQAELGNGMLEVVRQALRNVPGKLNQTTLGITVTGYDTRGTTQGAASAAARAAADPDTVAIIGPLDVRHGLAVFETVRGMNIPVLLPASTAPGLASEGQTTRLYQLPAQDQGQAKLIIDFLYDAKILKTDLPENNYVFLLVENLDAAGLRSEFDSAFAAMPEERLRFVGAVSFTAQTVPVDLGQQIKDSGAKAVILIGGADSAFNVLQQMNQVEVTIPLVGLGLMYDPAIAAAIQDVPVYILSSFLDMGIIPEQLTDIDYASVLGEYASKPYAFETLQATWCVVQALPERLRAGVDARQEVWLRIGSTWLAFPNSSTSLDLSVPRVYVYQAFSDWGLNKLVSLYSGR
ncbi:MAG: ABC transporter substrate-binding protein [Anaerolineales bacterium]|nr:ABC transporter substrate-binding protein [Anaerolineales bacterium]